MKRILPILFVLASAPACLGGGSEGSVAGLSLPSGVDLVTVASGAEGSALAGATQTNFPADSDYATDPARRHVWDVSTEPLEIINGILEQLSQTCADKLVNQGPYLALIEIQDDGGGSSSNQSSAGNAVEYEPWIVDSTRASSSAPQFVRFWIEGEEELEQGSPIESMIHALATMTAEPDAQNPFGQFSIDFAMTEGLLGAVFQRGVLSAGPAAGGLAGFTFLVDADRQNGGGDIQIAVETNPARTAGRARVRMTDWETGVPMQFLLAFDRDHFARKVGNQVRGFDRDSYRVNTWGYNLYWAADGDGHSAGDRVELESGFPFTFTHQGSKQYGHVGYWGIWSPSEGLPAHGTVVTRETRDGSPGRHYTVVRAPGRLVHVQRVQVPIADLDGAEFEYWDWPAGDRYQAVYEHDELNGWGLFLKTAIWVENTGSWDPIEPPDPILQLPGEWLGLWSRTLGGSVSYVGGEASAQIQQESYASGDDSIFGGNDSLALYGLTQCLKPALTAAQVEVGDVWFADQLADSPKLYQFRRDTRTLMHGGARVGLLPGEVPTTGPFTWGMRSGPLTTTPPEDLGIQSAWEMWGLDDYYYWETGHNPWNQYATVRDGQGRLLTFDPPLGFVYRHEQQNDANGDAAYAGQSFWLQYGGAGQLWGIPQGDVDVDGDLSPDRWLPLFSLADGTVVGASDEYVVKAIDSELTMTPTADNLPASLLQALSAAAQLVLPTLANWTDPVDRDVPTDLGEPRVVGGVLVQ